MAGEIAGANCPHAVVGAAAQATGWVSRTETWHSPQHSRDENAGPDVSVAAVVLPDVSLSDWCPCLLRQQLALLPLQQHDPLLESCANARNGMGWANKNATSAIASQWAVREGIMLSIRLKRPKASRSGGARIGVLN
jgi:hypothetical protein